MKFAQKNLKDVDLELISQLTEGFSGSELEILYREVSSNRVKKFIKRSSSQLLPSGWKIPIEMVQNLEALDDISMDDFTTVLGEMKKTTNILIKAFCRGPHRV